MRSNLIIFMTMWAVCFVNAMGSITVGSMLGKQFVVTSEPEKLDTLDWDEIEKAFALSEPTNQNHPLTACRAFQQKGKKFIRVTEVSAIALAILKDLGYDIICLSQWFSFTQDDIAFGASNDYKKQRFATPFMWERVTGFDVEKASSNMTDMKVTLKFDVEGHIVFNDKDMVINALSQLLGTTEGFDITYVGGGGEAQTPKRKIYEIYLVVDEKKKDKSIISDIETLMDKLKLDMSYSIPKLKQITCAD